MNSLETQPQILDSGTYISKGTIPQSSQVSRNSQLAVEDGKIKNKTIPIWLHLLFLPISSQVTIGLAKIFDLEILTHGTSFKNCYGILKNGVDPSKGGTEIGSTSFYAGGDKDNSMIKNARNYFYVFKDSEAKQGSCRKITRAICHIDKPPTTIIEFKDKKGNVFKEQQFNDLSIANRLELYFSPRFHAALAAIAHTDSIKSNVKKIAEQVFYGVPNFFFSPTLRFTYTLDETKSIFIEDQDYSGYAYKTSERLPNSRIGLIGVCKNANIAGFKRGVQKRPLRVMAGVVHLLVGSVLTCTGLGLVV